MSKLTKNLIKHLKTDEDFYYGWQANIAMSFYDEVRRNKKLCRVSNENLHIISNTSAKNFLDMLIK